MNAEPADAEQLRDEGRFETALNAIRDILSRVGMSGAGNFSAYDVLSYLLEDLIVEDGFCAACIHEALVSISEEQGVDLKAHQPDEKTVYH